jgi:hypothetical protein
MGVMGCFSMPRMVAVWLLYGCCLCSTHLVAHAIGDGTVLLKNPGSESAIMTGR